VRSRAVENLSSSWHSRDTERVFASLRDESPQVRCAAVRALEKSKRPDALKSLVGALSDRAAEVREAAALVLSRLGQAGKAKDAAGVLTRCLRDPEPSVRRAAAGGLRALGWRPSTREEAARFDLALSNTADNITGAPTLAPDPSPETNTNTAFHRRMRAEAEKEKNDPAKVSALLAAAHGSDLLARIFRHPRFRTGNRPASSLKKLLKFICDREPEVRLAAVQALSIRTDTLPAAPFGRARGFHSDVRLTAVRYFRQSAEPPNYPPFVAAAID